MSIKHASLVAAVLTAVGLAGCGSDNHSADPAPPTAKPAVVLADTELGTILADGNGNTLYLFTKDTPTTSACTGDCASNWPPIIGGDSFSLGAGLDAADFGTIDSATPDQLTFHGHPLYYYAGDVDPGDTNGEGIGANWYVIDASGSPIR
jgi:predicted lipoprotein with Yx(FWY)xxD motif